MWFQLHFSENRIPKIKLNEPSVLRKASRKKVESRLLLLLFTLQVLLRLHPRQSLAVPGIHGLKHRRFLCDMLIIFFLSGATIYIINAYVRIQRPHLLYISTGVMNLACISSRELVIKFLKNLPWLVWLSGLSAGL